VALFLVVDLSVRALQGLASAYQTIREKGQHERSLAGRKSLASRHDVRQLSASPRSKGTSMKLSRVAMRNRIYPDSVRASSVAARPCQKARALHVLTRLVFGLCSGLLLFPDGAFADGVPAGAGQRANPSSGCVSPMCSVALSAEDRDALGRLAYAEAGNQGEEGLAAVIYAVLNRLVSGRFGANVRSEIESPGQFEPVGRVGGQWQHLPPLSPTQSATIATIINLIQQGRLPDPTDGATFFQNPQIVARRAAAGEVPTSLVNFNNQTPIAVVRDHAFFDQLKPGRPEVGSAGTAGHLVYPPGASPAVRVERVDAGTPAHPRAVLYRIVSVSRGP
jgi:Cell Wall Hydrolase